MSFFSELKRRNVFRVGIVYAIVAWLMLQVVDVLVSLIAAPQWAGKAILLLLVIGFPLALLFAWAYELTPEGLKREREVDRAKSITRQTGRKLDFIIIAVLAFAVIFFALDRFLWSRLEIPRLVTEDTRRSIAVLPFVNMSGDPEQTYFSDGISEEILNALVRVEGISVASRTSSFTYRGELQSIPEIATELGVLFILEGSVRKADDQVRITAQLIDAENDRHLWSNSYDRQLTDIFAIQSEIANAITDSLKDILGLEDVASVPVRTPTENMDAYDLYLKGHNALMRRSIREDVADSIRYLEEAVATDPEFAIGWESLAAAYSVAPAWRLDEHSMEEYLQLSEQAVDRALSIDPGLSFAYAIKGSNASSRPPFDLVSAMELLDFAIEMDPMNPTSHHWRATNLLFMGFFDDSIAGQERCLEIDSLYVNCLYYLLHAQHALGRHEAAMDTFDRLSESAAPADTAMDVPALWLGGNRSAAIIAAHGVRGLRGAPHNEWIRALEHPEADHSLGLARFEAWADENGVDLGAYPEILAAFRAYDRLENRLNEEPWYWLPSYEHYRSSAEFKRMIHDFGILQYWRAKGFPPQCRPIGEDDFECD